MDCYLEEYILEEIGGCDDIVIEQPTTVVTISGMTSIMSNHNAETDSIVSSDASISNNSTVEIDIYNYCCNTTDNVIDTIDNTTSTTYHTYIPLIEPELSDYSDEDIVDNTINTTNTISHVMYDHTPLIEPKLDSDNDSNETNTISSEYVIKIPKCTLNGINKTTKTNTTISTSIKTDENVELNTYPSMILHCKRCNKIFFGNKEYNMHMKTHGTSCKCNKCGYVSASRKQLTRHKCKNIYACEICDVKYIYKKPYDKHMKSHTC